MAAEYAPDPLSFTGADGFGIAAVLDGPGKVPRPKLTQVNAPAQGRAQPAGEVRMLIGPTIAHRLALGAATLLLLGGVAVCLAWEFGAGGATRLLLTSSVVHFNTGLLFAVAGTGLTAGLRGHRRWEAACAGLVVLGAALVLAQYLLQADFGIDELFVPVAGLPDGHVAPNTAVAFVLGGLAMLFLGASARLPWAIGIVQMLGALVVAMGGVALLGYAVDLPAAFQWAGLTRMAVLTAGWFVLFGIALMLAGVHASGSVAWHELPWLGATAGLAVAALTGLAWYALRQAPAGTHAPLADVVMAFGLLAAALLAGAVAQAKHLRRQAAELARANAALKATSAEVADLYDQAPCGYHSLDRDGVYVRINQTELDWLGRTREEVVQRLRIMDVITPRSREVVRESFSRFLETGVIKDLVLELVHRDGSVRPVLLSASAVYDAQGRFLHSRSTAFDITERLRAETVLRDSEARLQALLDGLQTAVVVHGADTGIRYANPAAVAILGLTRDQLLGKTTIDSYWHFVREDGKPMPVEQYPVSLALARRAALHDYVVGVREAPDRPTRWVLVNAVPDIDAGGAVRQIVVSFVDISERKRQAQQFEALAITDSLTGLSTRRHFLAAGEREIARAHRGHPLSMLVFDVDHFKAINDGHGHAVGDRVLVQLAQAVRTTLREEDLAGRLGGEEFAVLLPDTDEPHAVSIAERLRGVVAASVAPLEGGGELRFTVSIGVATWEAEPDVTALVARADQAMYRAKRGGRNRVELAQGAVA